MVLICLSHFVVFDKNKQGLWLVWEVFPVEGRHMRLVSDRSRIYIFIEKEELLFLDGFIIKKESKSFLVVNEHGPSGIFINGN